MKTIEIKEFGAIVSLSTDEILIVNNALNEICNGIEVPEFGTRIGASLQEALALLEQVTALLDAGTNAPP